MGKKIPNRIEKALLFCCCFPYRDYQICIYAGGGSSTEHSMYWGCIIYTQAGNRYLDSLLPSSCLDVGDGLRYAETVVDAAIAARQEWQERQARLKAWQHKPLDYEEVRLWRDICEFMHNCKGYLYEPEDLYKRFGYEIEPLISYDRARRQLLWDNFKLQLIIWEKGRRREPGGWSLKGNWEDKIDFLEQVYILGRDPDSLPRLWLDKWEKKQKKADIWLDRFRTGVYKVNAPE